MRATTAGTIDDPIGALAELSASTPRAEVRLAAAVEAMETTPSAMFPALAAAVEQAEQLAITLGRPDLRMRARLLQADILSMEGDATESARISHEVHAWATEHNDAYVLSRSHRGLSLFYFHIGEYSDALAHAVQSVAFTSAGIAPALRARHLSTLGAMLQQNGSPDEAHQRFAEALDITTATGDVRMSMQILNNMAYTECGAGRLSEAQQLVERMRVLQDRDGVRLTASDLDTIARVELTCGRYAEAVATMRPILDGAAEYLMDGGTTLAECLLTVAEAQRLDGDVTAARATLDRTVADCEARGLASTRARAREEQSRLYAATGRYREAYEEHQVFYADMQALQSAQREARARILQAVFETEEARRESTHFREMAYRDALTGLYNRRFVDEQLTPLLEHAAERRSPLSVAIIDLDHFKRVNDTLSHATGDAVLQRMARLLTQAAADDGVAARLGGEEFLLVLPGTDAHSAIRRCELLRLSIGEHDWLPVTGDLVVTASIGVTTAADGRGTQSALLAQADRNLYVAKRSGRNRVVADPS
ncbi:diguanylate cyclase [Krasilnikovia sp. MM14-A1004]|uniref:GGDEF domain-containing protein n=1 Tax=Krasilnikovia sp. MM14-A1004 TaxID=3373541 RepID=UPI00399D1C43